MRQPSKSTGTAHATRLLVRPPTPYKEGLDATLRTAHGPQIPGYIGTITPPRPQFIQRLTVDASHCTALHCNPLRAKANDVISWPFLAIVGCCPLGAIRPSFNTDDRKPATPPRNGDTITPVFLSPTNPSVDASSAPAIRVIFLSHQ